MPQEAKIVWIDWGIHLRTQTLSHRLGVHLEEIAIPGSRPVRYFQSAVRTIKTLHSKRPDVVIATNPSIILGCLLLVLRAWFGFKLVSDAHYLGVKAADGNRLWQGLLNRFNARVDLAIVTNENHAAFLAALGTPTYVCEDPLPLLPASSSAQILAAGHAVFLICSFDSDEPYEAAFDAFSSLKERGYTLFVSGNYRKAQVDVTRFSWVEFLGFLPFAQYYEYLRSCSVIMDLTTLEDCLVCGAYEALAAEKALILSRTTALEAYFGDAVVLTDNSAARIRDSVVVACTRRAEFEQKARDWVAKNQPYMSGRIATLKLALASMRRP